MFEAWVEVGEATRGESGAACGELQEGLPLVGGHPAQHPHKAQKARAVDRSTELSQIQPQATVDF